MQGQGDILCLEALTGGMEVADDPLLPDESTDDSPPEIKVEPVEPADIDEAMIKVAAAMTAMTEDPGGYHVEMTVWYVGGGPKIKVSTHVHALRALLGELHALQAILTAFEEVAE